MQEHKGSGQAGAGGVSYRAFLLRCWQEPGAGPEGWPAWRFTLVQAEGEGGQKGFAGLEELVDYLRAELEGNETLSSGE